MPVETNAELDAWEGLAATLQPSSEEVQPSPDELQPSPDGLQPSPAELQASPDEEAISQPAGEVSEEGEPRSVAGPEAGPGPVPVDPDALATLVGEEVASVLKAAQVAAAEIRSKAEDVAAQAQRRISEMQSALAQMSAEMTELMVRTAGRVPFVTRASTGGLTTLDEPIVLEHRSGNGTPASGSRPDVSDRPGDYQRWLQRMVELSSQEPR